MRLIEPSPKLSSDILIEFLRSRFPTLSTLGTAPKEIKAICPVDDKEVIQYSLSFIRSKETNQINKQIELSKSDFFIISESAQNINFPTEKWIIKVSDPQIAYILIQEKFFIDREERFLPKGIHATAIIDESSKISGDVKIGAYVVIGANCVIGENCIIHPHVVLYNDVKIGNRTIIHSKSVIREHVSIGNNCIVQAGTVIGSDGFGYVPDPQIGLRAMPQVGNVVISDNVEIGSNTCVDRAASGSTSIKTGTKIDNLVQIGHNVEIGANSIICGQVGIGGSSVVGSQVVLGGKVGVADHMEITSGARIGGAGIVISHLKEPGDYMGYPATPAFKWRRIVAAQQSLPDILKSFNKNKE